MSYQIINGQPYYHNKVSRNGVQNNSLSRENKNNVNFDNILKRQIAKKSYDEGFKVSAHAAERLKDINLTKEDFETIQGGLNKARIKGSKNTLMLFKEMAIVASVENNTIITAVDKERAKENVFTNIDSVVIL